VFLEIIPKYHIGGIDVPVQVIKAGLIKRIEFRKTDYWEVKSTV
jgi:hypothetical protein